MEEGAYTLTADNIRAALDLGDDEPITLDHIRQNEAVWQRCREDVGTYLDAVRQDDRTEYAVLENETLSGVVSEQYETWSDGEMKSVLAISAPDAALDDITEVPTGAWSSIIRAHRIVPSVKNVLECTGASNVDADLAGFLESVDQLEDIDELAPDNRYKLALRMLNTPTLEPSQAVRLTKQLDLQQELSVSDLEPGADDLLARLLESNLVPDQKETFAHFIAGAGWPAVAEAFAVSKNVEKFLSPALVSGVVADLLNDPQTSVSIKATVVNKLDEYASKEDKEALRAAGRYARKAKIELPIDQVERIAASGSAIDEVLWQLDANKDLMADDLLRTLAKLGEEYLGFAQGSDHEFDVRTTPELDRILRRLTKEKRVETGPAVQGSRKVRIA